MKKRILSTLLAVLFVLGSVSIFSNFVVIAADTDGQTIADYYLKDNVFNNPQEKLATMELMLENYGYQLYVDSQSGEVALVETATGNYLFSNPYDVASSKGSSSISTGGTTGTKEQLLLSQIIVQYVDNGTTKYLYSFQDAAMRNQISVSRIKSGVRVEYTIGQQEFRKLVPRWIPQDVFDELIKQPLIEAVINGEIEGGVPASGNPEDNFYYRQFMTYYQLKDPALEDTQGAIDAMYEAYPITKEFPIYVFATDASSVEINKVEGYIKDYCPDYSFEQMDADHEATGYEATDDEYPVFKMALEYSLDEDGLSVRLPCNGLQYNMSSYTLENISILPYMGAGNTKNEGYNFYPDGSGSLFDFNLNRTNTIRGKIYGIDYAYHQISGTYQKPIRVPVYGTVATEIMYSYGYILTTTDEEGNVTVDEKDVTVSNTVKTREEIEAFLSGESLESNQTIEVTKPLTESSYKRGYVAIIESGESLGEIETYFAGALSDYATMSNYFNPKPKDSYDIADSISVTSSSTWTVVSPRKYTGNISIHYQLLCDEQIGAATQAEDSSYRYYDATWLGMAEAYRDYLVKNGTLTKLTEEDVSEDIPLYMEVFGTVETQQIVATLPMTVQTPLTTFEDILTMYNELAERGVKNINFKLTGFANGGMYSSIPASLNWESKVGGKSGFRDLIESAQEINDKGDGSHLGLYPDFDFAYCIENSLFDALSLKKDAIRTIDNRYSSLRQYSATQQKYVSFYQLAISPSRYSKFYEKLIKNYSKYDINTMSVGTLGNALNSDFDEDDPYNREDSKEFTVKAFEDLKAAGYQLMTDGGNVYSWAYVDHILNMDLDSSRYVRSSCSVPFLGAVLHGYVQFAGGALNEEGNTDYAILKAIENGAGMYFILSYQNTEELKEDELLSQYYSIRYDIWREDVATYYNELNSLLSDVQTMLIVDHRFLNYNSTDANGNMFFTERVLDPDELEQDIKDQLEQAEEEAKENERNEAINQVASVAEARIALQKSIATLQEVLSGVEALNTSLATDYAALVAQAGALETTCNQSLVDAFRSVAVQVWLDYTELEYQYQLADETIAWLEDQLEVIRAAKEGTSAEYQYTEALAQLNAAKEYLQSAKDEQLAKYNALTGNVAVEAAVEALLNQVVEIVNAYNTANPDAPLTVDLTMDSIKEEGTYVPEPDDTGDDNTEEEEEISDYYITDNSVVSVTYGTIDDATGQKTAYKTFILNYNNFAVRVTYNGVVYTVPGNGYVVVPVQN